jgi:hypothetical protein
MGTTTKGMNTAFCLLDHCCSACALTGPQRTLMGAKATPLQRAHHVEDPARPTSPVAVLIRSGAPICPVPDV